MGERTSIEWTDHTFNPWWGCTKISPGCDHCYAEGVGARFGTPWGAGQPRREFGEKHWAEPLRWNARATRDGVRRRVFCASMADVFDNEAPDGARVRLLQLIADTPNLDWLLLTKRIGSAHRLLDDAIGELSHGLTRWRDAPWPNVWIGATIVNQEEADRDIPKLLAVPAHVRFLSMEPLLGPVDIRNIRVRRDGNFPNELSMKLGDYVLPLTGAFTDSPRVHWVIAGGESGSEARPMHPGWARSLRDQCAAAGVPFLFKQWGEWAPHQCQPGGDEGGDLRRGHVRYLAGDEREPDGHFRRGDAAVARVGKKVAGRLLDGVQHDAVPAVL